jgi:hypothetical protein
MYYLLYNLVFMPSKINLSEKIQSGEEVILLKSKSEFQKFNIKNSERSLENTQKKKFLCNYKECNRHFNSSSRLLIHLQNHVLQY